MLGKPAVVSWPSWFETDWSAVDKIGVLFPEDMMLRPADECGEQTGS